MNADDIRKRADAHELMANASELYSRPLSEHNRQNCELLRALADVVEAAKEEHRDHRVVCMTCQALARVEALKP